ncbi:hypothetical protein J6590_031093 [Homalodisca vitripennis]|nr:hypothetical protein J6590_031093 [Homalodisca vitripennis]
MATLSAASRRNSSGSTPPSPRPSLATSRLSSLGEEESDANKTNRARMCSERSDSGISDCSSINTCAARPLLGKKYSICEEPECDPSSYSRPGVNTNRSCDGVNGKLTSGVSVTAKIRSTSSLRPRAEPPAKAPSPTLQKDAKLFSKNENFQKAFAFWKQ